MTVKKQKDQGEKRRKTKPTVTGHWDSMAGEQQHQSCAQSTRRIAA